MARSFQPAAASSLSSRLQSLNLDHQPSGQHFTARRTDGRYSVRRTGTTRREQTVGAFEQGVDYVIGSGDHAANFLHRTADGQLIELPVTWYTSEGSWGMSPGYDRPDHLGFSRAITYRCLFCHNAYPDVPEGAANWDGETVLPSSLAAGIDCQRCHGPGAAHIAAVRGGKERPGDPGRHRQPGAADDGTSIRDLYAVPSRNYYHGVAGLDPALRAAGLFLSPGPAAGRLHPLLRSGSRHRQRR